jgi:class 3 adenylate cyclase
MRVHVHKNIHIFIQIHVYIHIYTACSGVINWEEDHTQHLVMCALDFQDAISYFHAPDNKPIQVRIGVHTGFTVAGVIGKTVPRYHLFGNTVTIAEEVEKQGIPGE